MKVLLDGRIIDDFDDVEFKSFIIAEDVEKNLEVYREYEPDLVLQIDSGSTTINGRDFLSQVSCPKAYYNFDAFCDLGRMYRGYITHFDFVFNVDSWLAPTLKPRKKAYFLPISLMNAQTFPVRRKFYDVIFFGSVEKKVYGDSRLPYISLFEKEFGASFYFSEHRGYSFHAVNEYANRMAESKVAINLGFMNHLSVRPFEALAARCSVVSTPLTDIESVEGLRERIQIATSPEEMVETVKEEIEAWDKVRADEDRAWIMENHTIQNRVKTIIDSLKQDGYL